MLRSIRALAIFRHTTLRKRLWQAGIAMAVLIVTIAATNRFLSPDKRVSSDMLGHDFLPFYVAGSLVRNGCADLLYDLPTIRDAEHEVAAKNGLEIGSSFGPFWNPPWYALPFAPLATLPYREALLCWTLANVAALLAAIVLMLRMLSPRGREPDWRTALLVPLLIFVSMPFVQAISHAQNTFTSLLIVTLIVTAWRARKPVAGGICCGLLLYKPQLAVVLAAMMTLDLGPRVLLSMGSVGASLVLVTAWQMPGAIGDWLVRLPANLRFMQVESAYLWERHVTLRAFWRLLLQGRGPGEMSAIAASLTTMCSLAIVAGLLIARFRRGESSGDPWTGESSSRRRDRLIAATIAVTPLLMPFYFDYDLLLLAVPAVLLSAEIGGGAIGASLSRRDRCLIGCWFALALWMMLNPALAKLTHVNGTVILLAALSSLLTARAADREALASMVDAPIAVVATRRRRAA